MKPHDFRWVMGTTQLASKDIRKAQLALGQKSREILPSTTFLIKWKGEQQITCIDMHSGYVKMEDEIMDENQDTSYWTPIEPTMPVANPYDDGYEIGIPPPPPHALHKKRPLWLLILLSSIVILLMSAGVSYAIVSMQQQNAQQQKAYSDATATSRTNLTAIAQTTATASTQSTFVAATQISLNATSTQVSSHVTATAIQRSIDATVTASLPTPTPIPSVNTAENLYGQFINAGIAMGGAGVISNNQWLQDGFSYYPGRGNISFIDEASHEKMVIALFNTANGASTDASQIGGGWGTYQLGACLLFYQSASTNLTPYEQVMQQDCV